MQEVRPPQKINEVADLDVRKKYNPWYDKVCQVWDAIPLDQREALQEKWDGGKPFHERAVIEFEKLPKVNEFYLTFQEFKMFVERMMAQYEVYPKPEHLDMDQELQ